MTEIILEANQYKLSDTPDGKCSRVAQIRYSTIDFENKLMSLSLFVWHYLKRSDGTLTKWKTPFQRTVTLSNANKVHPSDGRRLHLVKTDFVQGEAPPLPSYSEHADGTGTIFREEEASGEFDYRDEKLKNGDEIFQNALLEILERADILDKTFDGDSLFDSFASE